MCIRDRALLDAAPVPDPEIERSRQRTILEGDIPSPLNPPSGCVFSTRCPLVTDECKSMVPELDDFAPGHGVACIKIGAS